MENAVFPGRDPDFQLVKGEIDEGETQQACMGREEGKGRPLQAPHLSVVKAVVHVPPVKSSQCPTMDSLQQIQTCSALSEITVLWGCSQPPKVNPQKLVFITELAGLALGPAQVILVVILDKWANGLCF